VSVESTAAQGSTFTFTIPQELGNSTEVKRELAAVG